MLQGIGRRFSNVVCKKANVDITKRAGELSEEEVRVFALNIYFIVYSGTSGIRPSTIWEKVVI